MLVACNVERVVHGSLHPGRLETITLCWIRVLESLRGLLACVLMVNSDPAIVFAEQAVRLVGLAIDYVLIR